MDLECDASYILDYLALPDEKAIILANLPLWAEIHDDIVSSVAEVVRRRAPVNFDPLDDDFYG